MLCTMSWFLRLHSRAFNLWHDDQSTLVTRRIEFSPGMVAPAAWLHLSIVYSKGHCEFPPMGDFPLDGCFSTIIWALWVAPC